MLNDLRFLGLGAIVTAGAILGAISDGALFMPLLAAPVAVSAVFGRPSWSGSLGLYSIMVASFAHFVADGSVEPKTVLEILVATAAATLLSKAVAMWQRRLQREQRRFRAAVDSAGIAMAFGPVDSDAIVHLNDALCEFFELPREDILGRRWQEFTHPDDLAADQAKWQALCDGDIDRYELTKRYRLDSGIEKWGVLTVARLDDLGEGTPWAIEQIVDVTTEVQAQERLQHAVDYDTITGLHSRDWITQTLQRELRAGPGRERAVGVMFIDLSEYVVVNRALGYLAGDAMLREIATDIANVLPSGAHIGRFTGLSFVAVLPDADASLLQQEADRILAVARQERALGDLRFARSGSIGMALSARGIGAAELLRDADQALLQAKAEGGSRAHLFDREAAGAGADRLQREHDLRVALAERQFVVHYQPQVRLADRTVVGFEALVRWQHPERGLVGPDEFIPVLEQTDLILDLGRQVVDMVCERLAADASMPPVSVNVSAQEFTDNDWLSGFLATVAHHGVTPDRLVVELTETATLQLTPAAQTALEGLRSRGFGLHLDDFGTGYASISMLDRVPLTALKLDRGFVWALGGAEDSAELVRGIGGLARGMHLEAIAEGIETEEQAQFLLDAGWTFGQGYLFGRPSPEPAPDPSRA